MKKARILSRVFGISALILLCSACSAVAFEYGVLLNAGRHFLTSAPPWVAFFLAIPFLPFIALCSGLYFYLGRRASRGY